MLSDGCSFGGARVYFQAKINFARCERSFLFYGYCGSWRSLVYFLSLTIHNIHYATKVLWEDGASTLLSYTIFSAVFLHFSWCGAAFDKMRI